MTISKADFITRRTFLKRAAQLSVVGTASPLLLTLAGLGDAAAASSAGNDYKALVCVFLNGGNDHANTVVPVDNVFYSKYQQLRQSLAIPQDALFNTILNAPQGLEGGMQLALAPQLHPLKLLFDAGKLGVQLNVGPLFEPTTLHTYQQKAARVPPKLFSHNDQASMWQSNKAEGAVAGWGGRMGDLMLNANAESSFTCISTSGNAVFVSGEQAFAYQITSKGSIPIASLSQIHNSTACGELLRSMMTAKSSNLLEQHLASINRRSIEAEGKFSAAFATQSLATPIPPDNPLADQLQAVARTIAGRSALGVKRQVFFVSIGGFDTHDDLNERHPALLKKVGDALSFFYGATVELGIADSVTTFTASDFGRTQVSNGDGSDHGWGGHHFILGGAVNGGRFYGHAPDVVEQDDYTIKGGRLIPTTSVDHMIYSLGSWFGVPAQAMPLVAPNIRNFDHAGFSYF